MVTGTGTRENRYGIRLAEGEGFVRREATVLVGGTALFANPPLTPDPCRLLMPKTGTTHARIPGRGDTCPRGSDPCYVLRFAVGTDRVLLSRALVLPSAVIAPVPVKRDLAQIDIQRPYRGTHGRTLRCRCIIAAALKFFAEAGGPDGG